MEPEKAVLSRSADECVVALCDQWFVHVLKSFVVQNTGFVTLSVSLISSRAVASVRPRCSSQAVDCAADVPERPGVEAASVSVTTAENVTCFSLS